LAFISAGAGLSILLAAGVMQFHLVPRPLPQTILIFFLAKFPPDFLYRGAYRGNNVPGA